MDTELATFCSYLVSFLPLFRQHFLALSNEMALILQLSYLYVLSCQFLACCFRAPHHLVLENRTQLLAISCQKMYKRSITNYCRCPSIHWSLHLHWQNLTRHFWQYWVYQESVINRTKDKPTYSSLSLCLRVWQYYHHYTCTTHYLSPPLGNMSSSGQITLTTLDAQ